MAIRSKASKKIKNVKSFNHFKLTQNTTWLLLASQVANTLMLVSELSWWMLLMIALLVSSQAVFTINSYKKSQNDSHYKHQNKYRQTNGIRLNKKSEKRALSSWLLICFALCGAVVIAISSSSLGVLSAMVHLLCFAYILKSFELRTRKDFYQLVLLGLFILTSAFIFSQHLLFSIIGLLVVILNLTLLLQHFSSNKKIQHSLKITTMLLVQSSFLAIILFLFFPRITPFWQVPSLKSATTGLSQSLSPGDIADLALSTDLAFRVTFDNGNVPPYSELYWRAMVLENFDGRKWTRVAKKPVISNPKPFDSNLNEYSYQVIVQPSFQTWLFSLPYARSSDSNVDVLPDFTLQSKALITQSKAYKVTSTIGASRDIWLSDHVKKRNLTYPVNSNPKLEALGARLKQEYADPSKRAQAVLSHFRIDNYYYTLKPPLLNQNSLDQFYFETQAGFCSHYASAFTFIMRSAGIPSRLVTGYLGGEINEETRLNTVNEADVKTNELQSDMANGDVKERKGHLNVYQYEAHAWSEIWIEGKGWVRVDPTSAVDPSRVNSGWSQALLQEQSSLNSDFISLYQLKQMPWLNTLRLKYDAVEYQWTRWVVGYSTDKQLALLKQLFGNLKQYKVILLIIGALISIMSLFILSHYLLTRYKKYQQIKRAKTPYALVIYNKALVAIAKKGVVKRNEHTVSTFNKAVGEHFTHNAQVSRHFTTISVIYSRLTYKKVSKASAINLHKSLDEEYKRLKKQLRNNT